MDGTPPHARTKRHPQPPASASRWGRDERRVGPREGRPAVEQRAVVVAGCRPQLANLHLPGKRLGLGECWAGDDPPVGKRRILTDPEAEAACVRSLRPESGRGVADMPNERSGMDKRLARHGRDHRHGAIGLRGLGWCWCWNRGCLGRTVTRGPCGRLRRHDGTDAARRLEEKLASRGVRHRHGLSSRESVTPSNASVIIHHPAADASMIPACSAYKQSATHSFRVHPASPPTHATRGHLRAASSWPPSHAGAGLFLFGGAHGAQCRRGSSGGPAHDQKKTPWCDTATSNR